MIRLLIRLIPWLLLLFVALMAVLTPNPDDVRSESSLVYGLAQSVSGLDPHLHNSPEQRMILRQVYDTLLYRDPATNNFVPGLAQSWEISEDRLQYTFTLRQNVRFHDGTAFNAQAVAVNLGRILDPAWDTTGRALLGPIVGYEVLDEYTIQVQLSHPFEPLLDAFSQIALAIASPSVLDDYEDAPLRYQFHQVGTGAFRFVEYIPEQRVVLQRNPDYAWQPDFIAAPTGTPAEEIIFRFFPDANAPLDLITAGHVDVFSEVSYDSERSLPNNNDVALLPVLRPGEPLHFAMNTALPPTDNILVRQALAYGTNRVSIVDAAFGGFAPLAWGPIAAETLFYNRGVRNVYAYNLEQAQLLLAQAGYTDSDADGYLDQEGERLTIRVLHRPIEPLTEVVTLMQEQWESIGIEGISAPVPGKSTLREAIAEGDYHLVADRWVGLDPYFLNESYFSTSVDNWTGYQNVELDSVLLDAAETGDPQERRLLYGRVQAFILEQALILPIADQTVVVAHGTHVQDLRFDAYGIAPLLYGVSLQRSGQ